MSQVSVNPSAHNLSVTKTGGSEIGASLVRRRRFVRRMVGGALLAAVVSGAALYAFRDAPVVRLALLRAIGAAYAVCDVWTSEPVVITGPQRIAIDQNLERPELPDHCTFTPSTLPAGSAVASTIDFLHEDLSHPRVVEMREVAANACSQSNDVFELCNALRAMTHHGAGGISDDDSNPLTWLRFMQDQKLVTCKHFAVVFAETCVIEGYTARVLGLSAHGDRFDHAVVEVYVPEHGKWILIDPDFNVAFRREGRWLDAGEIHELRQSMKAQSLQTPAEFEAAVKEAGLELVVLGEAGQPLRRSNLGEFPMHRLLPYFEIIFYRARNNYLSASYPVGHPHSVRQYVLRTDRRGPLPVCPEAIDVGSRDTLYWPVGRTTFSFAATTNNNPKRKRGDFGSSASQKRGPALEVYLDTYTPNFSGFEIRTDDGEWSPAPDLPLWWPLHDGVNRLSARSVNAAGLRGETATIEIEVNEK